MNLQKVENDFVYDEIRYRGTVEGEPVFVHLTREAWDDVMRGSLSADQQKNIEGMADARFKAGEFVERKDRVGVPYNAILFTTDDF